MTNDQAAIFALIALIWIASFLRRIANGVETIGGELRRLRELAQRRRG